MQLRGNLPSAERWWQTLERVLNYPLLRLGESTLTLGTIGTAIVLTLLLFWIVAVLRRWLTTRLLTRGQMDDHARHTIGTVVSYVLILVGFMVILQTVGIDLTTLNVLAGAIGVGIGLGLQEVANNFISGVIILFERPIKVGDRVVVGEIEGAVAEIRARSTTIVTFDNIAVIVPNSKFVTENVVNWSYTDPKVRFRIPVGVAYGTDPRLVERALIEAAREVPEVLADPPPNVFFKEFGDSSLNFEVRAWTTTLLYQRGGFVSNINFAIHRKLEEHGIAVPFPQRDLHVRSGDLRVVVRSEGEK
ncbi:MAG TPA: mechanosensitive ion channel domain-containing protein [Gemmatimonadaceae bacterium]|nr:mechanosensitive ion channel domain-containing protein [Gemmatimonadaceae bacterium]